MAVYELDEPMGVGSAYQVPDSGSGSGSGDSGSGEDGDQNEYPLG